MSSTCPEGHHVRRKDEELLFVIVIITYDPHITPQIIVQRYFARDKDLVVGSLVGARTAMGTNRASSVPT